MDDYNHGASHRHQQQAEPVQPLQQACEQSVLSVQVVNDTMKNNQSVSMSAAENIQDSMDSRLIMVKQKAAAANADQGLVASTMNGQTTGRDIQSKTSPSKSPAKEKTTTLK